MIDTPTAIEAADNWRRLADLVPLVRLYLEPRRGHSEAGRTAPKSKPPIDLGASDLLFDLDTSASFYCSALLMETDDVKRMPDALEDQLRLIAKRYGHFTADADEKIALDFCDEAHELMRKVEVLIVQPLPPQWAGPCAMGECDGGMFQSRAQGTAKCDTCGATITDEAWRAELLSRLDSRLMTRQELVPALKMLAIEASGKAVDGWIARKRLQPVIADAGLFRLSDAIDCAGTRGKHVRAKA